MSLYTDIKTIVEGLYPDATFRFLSSFHINEEANKIAPSALPLIVLDNTIDIEDNIGQNANTLAKSTIIMHFLTKHTDKNNVNMTDLEMDSLIQSMAAIARRVYHNIYILDKITAGNKEVSKYRLKPCYKKFSAVLSGVTATANWKERISVSWCPST